MADETSSEIVAEIAVPDAPVKAKKTRGPNKPKSEASKAEPATVVASSTKRHKRADVDVAKLGTPKSTAKAVVMATLRKQTGTSATASAPANAGDEFADLIQLEEENKTLRKALADKLRQENSDLRKRLGIT
ncbi:SyrB-like regulator [Rhizobium sp. SL42]|uniref:SyrB-like regulator n=1 Tax=Rhizobium sp. SL42 TaxID=2806346 RepID=UPI001F35545B|nr:SyrB-like regulator [Rhizobium sp. SL42]UJW77758.1 SyrB-like regulator [Rhizobium sp. SL42]